MVAFGMQLPIQSQSTIFVQPWEPAAGAKELVQVARSCEAAGFDYVAVCDHVAIPADKADAMSTTWWDTIAPLSYLAAVTERVRLLSHVYVLPYRHPLAAAKAWATLDQLSGGRAILGVGTGHVTGTDAEDGPAPREPVERGPRLGGQQRVPVREDVHVAEQPHALGRRCEVGERGDGVPPLVAHGLGLAGGDGHVVADGDVVEAGRFAGPRDLHELGRAGAALPRPGVDRALGLDRQLEPEGDRTHD